MGFWKKAKATGEDDQIACPKCGRYLGLRKDLIAQGMRINAAMQDERAVRGMPPLQGKAISACPGCHHMMCV